MALEGLKIVHVADYLMLAMGYQEFMLAKWNARHRHEVHVFTSDRYSPLPRWCHVDPITVQVISPALATEAQR